MILDNSALCIYLEKITIKPLKDFVELTLTEYGTLSKLKKANKVADIVYQKFEHLGYITEHAQQQFVDITLAACLIHNIFYVENDITTLFKHRTKLQYIADICEIDQRLLDLVYDIIECQLGETHPIQKLKPLANSPSSTFADAVWQVNSYKSRL